MGIDYYYNKKFNAFLRPRIHQQKKKNDKTAYFKNVYQFVQYSTSQNRVSITSKLCNLMSDVETILNTLVERTILFKI